MNHDQTMLTRVYTAMLVFCLAGILSTAYLLDGPSDIEATQATASTAADAAHAAKQQARFERAAGLACAEMGAVALVDGSTMQCITPAGKKNIIAKVAL